ncbi:glutathione S-transferase family protein [Yoonia sp. 208BN28-4]|uniref:glutathione S-transferase family protein n=1 Tax=Yoonia sp. 208BN28-4 TaxID=3126505 RepID=UPI00309C550E
MYHLITFPPAFGEISASPFSIKAIWLMNHAGFAWTREVSNDPRKMPHGKLPVLRDGDRLIHDSGQIARFLSDHGADFWADTSPRDRALGHALIALAEKDLYFHQVLDRWGDDETFAMIRETFFEDVPRLLRGLIAGKLRRNLMQGLSMQGLGRLTPDERFAALDAHLHVIADALGEQPFLMGDQITLPDFSVAAVLSAMRGSPVPTRMSQRVTDDAALMAYVARVEQLVGET